MRALLRVAAVAVGGAVLYEAGIVNALVIVRPSPAGAVAVTLAIAAALVLIAMALLGTGQGEASSEPSPARAVPVRLVWLFVSVMAIVGLTWLRGVPSARVNDWTPYHNDAIALNECAAQAVLRGEDPYRRLDLFACYGARGLGPDRTTPLRRGYLADATSYPTDAQLDAAWDRRAGSKGAGQGEGGQGEGGQGEGADDVEFVWRPSYPALSIALILPWVALGWDTNVLYVACLLAAMGLVLVRSGPGMRPFVLTGLLGAASLTAFTVGGSSDLLYALPLVAAWLWRERRWSAVALGVALAVKQLAWPYGAFYVIQVVAQGGWREASRRLGIAAAVFAAANAPFVLWDAPAWLAGILTPVSEPAFPRGAGLVLLSVNGVLPLFDAGAYLVLEAAAAVAVLALAWWTRHTSQELGVALAMVPLFFAWRSLFSYFFLIPLFAYAGIARMTTGDLAAEIARNAGAVTLLAMPAKTS